MGAGASGGALDARRVEVGRGGLRDAGGELVRLVDHHGVVLGEHRHAVDRVDGQERVVGDDDVGVLGGLAGQLREALRGVRAARGTHALAVVDADLPPGAIGVRRCGLTVAVRTVAASRLARQVLGPLAQRQHLGAEASLGQVDESTLLVGHALAHAVQAGVVGAPLHDGVRRRGAHGLAGTRDQGWEVALDELVLQPERGGGDHHAVLVEQAGHEVAERLAGARPGLDQQVSTRAEGLGDGLRHGHLTWAFRAAEGADRGVQDLADAGLGAGAVGHGGEPRRTPRAGPAPVHSRARWVPASTSLRAR